MQKVCSVPIGKMAILEIEFPQRMNMSSEWSERLGKRAPVLFFACCFIVVIVLAIALKNPELLSIEIPAIIGLLLSINWCKGRC